MSSILIRDNINIKDMSYGLWVISNNNYLGV